MPRAATHYGHCQLCGAIQKLPKGVLSLHGYTVGYGFFNGICSGARALPFEQDYSLVEDAIRRADVRRKELVQQQDALRTIAGADTLMWIREWDTRTRKKYWKQVKLDAERRDYTDFWSARYSYTGLNFHGKEARIEHSGMQLYDRENQGHVLTLEDVRRQTVLKQNSRYADWLQHEVTSLERYVSWQRERVATWTPRPLVEVKPKKDTERFVPTEAAY